LIPRMQVFQAVPETSIPTYGVYRVSISAASAAVRACSTDGLPPSFRPVRERRPYPLPVMW
jgi:hypothetical protein